MNNSDRNFKVIMIIGAVILFIKTCTPQDISWKEEVQLSDDKVIVVEREAIYVSGGGEWASNPSGSKIDEYRIRFEYPTGSGKLVEWRSIKNPHKLTQKFP